MKSRLVGTGYRDFVCQALERSLTPVQTLIIAPRILFPAWEEYIEQYALAGRITLVIPQFKELPTHRLIIVDELHDTQNRMVAFKLRKEKEVAWLIDLELDKLNF